MANTKQNELFSVWKDPQGYGKDKWKVQFPKGILSFRTKKVASRIAAEFSKIAEISGIENAQILSQEIVQ